MKKCLSCHHIGCSTLTCCQSCGWSPTVKEGIPLYCPEIAENAGFKEGHFAQLAAVEEDNFWFQARNKLIVWSLGHYFPQFKSFLEIGCGTGFVLSGIMQAYPAREYKGSELFVKGLSHAMAKKTAARAEFLQMDARNIPYIDEFDCIGAFDVLEHIEEDGQVLSQIYQALKPGGMLLLTVPQHQWLWSQTDVEACHVRRYSKKNLHLRLNQAGFEMIRSSSFVFFLLPLMVVSRFLNRILRRKADSSTELRLSPLLNVLFHNILNAEIYLIRKGINFRIGGSRWVIARKRIGNASPD